MDRLIYPAPLYAFLNMIRRSHDITGSLKGIKILDCAAGGETPPLGLFHEYGCETWGIDISPGAVQLAQTFAEQYQMNLNIRQGDMRHLPFADATFDCVYEYNSIAHLSKLDTGIAIQEMHRVLKKGGLCFVGFMSLACWPILGRSVNDGEFCLMEGGEEVTHSAYADDEPDQYFSGWQIIQKEKHTRWYRRWSEQQSLTDWMGWYDPQHSDLTSAEWQDLYGGRVAHSNYSHLYYMLEKIE